MSGTELRDVQALIERVLPDPRGFAGRLLQQAVTEYGQFAEPAATALYTALAEDVTASETATAPDERAADEPPVSINSLLAAALGHVNAGDGRPSAIYARARARPAGSSRNLSCSRNSSGRPSTGCPPCRPLVISSTAG